MIRENGCINAKWIEKRCKNNKIRGDGANNAARKWLYYSNRKEQYTKDYYEK